MLLTVTSTAAPATDLGFLLHKHPGKVQSFDLAVGTAHVFYPEATEERCTAALLLEVDPIALVRGRPGADPRGGGHLQPRPVRQRPPLRGVVHAGCRPGKGLPHRNRRPL